MSIVFPINPVDNQEYVAANGIKYKWNQSTNSWMGDIRPTSILTAGAMGATGVAGPAGSAGYTGSQGPQGIPGTAVAQGATGATGIAGPQGPSGAIGSPVTDVEAVGSYVLAVPYGIFPDVLPTGTTYRYGNLIAGSFLRPSGTNDSLLQGYNLPGTWQCMGNSAVLTGSKNVITRVPSIWVRKF
jgi:hypothetical protein